MDPVQPAPTSAPAPRPAPARRQRAPRSPGSSKRNNPSNNRQLGRPALESPPLPPLTTTVPTFNPAIRTTTSTTNNPLTTSTLPPHPHLHDETGVAIVKRESIPELDRLAAAAAAVSAGGATSPFSTDYPFARPRTAVNPTQQQTHHRNSSAGLVGWSDRPPPHNPQNTSVDRSPRTRNVDSSYPYESLASPRHHLPPLVSSSSTSIMAAGPSSSSSNSRLSVSNSGRGRRRSGHSNAIIDIDPIILRERERMENERMQRELAVDRDRRVGPLSAASNNNIVGLPHNNNAPLPPPPHYSHQILPAARPSLSNDLAHSNNANGSSGHPPHLPPQPHPFGPPSSGPGRAPLDTFPLDASSRRRSSPSVERELRRRTSSLTTNPNSFLAQHHRLPTTSAAPIAPNSNPNANNLNNSNAGPLAGSSSAPPPPPLNAYPGGNQPSVMALPPGSGARIVDGPPGSNPGGVPPPGTVLIPSGGPGGPSVAGHHPHQVQSSLHPAHDNVGHDKMIILLGEVRSEYEAMQTDCMVLKGQRDEYENKSES